MGINMKRSAELKRTKGLQRRRWPKWHRRKDPVTQETRRLVWRRAGGHCEIGVVCGGAALHPDRWDPSHRIRRAEGFHGPEAILASCRLDHDRLPRDREESERNGWLLPFATKDPGLYPVRIRGKWWRLDKDGGRTQVAMPEVPA
jgi:hypothetical protein